MTDIKTLLKQYEEVNNELNKQIKENGKEFIQSLFQDIFDQHEGLNLVVIRGSTPSFNDGDPCTHSQETYVGANSYGSYFDYEDYDDMAETFKHEESEEGVKTHINSNCKSLDKVLDQVGIYDEIIERIYDTNFQITVIRNEDGKVSVTEDEYYCGY